MRKLLKWISVSDRFSKMYMDKHFAPMGINSSQHFYIIIICENPGLTQDKLMGEVCLNPSNVTRALAQLEREGYVTRTPSPRDKRTFLLCPTERAREAYPRILEVQAQWRETLTQGFSEDQREQLTDLLEKAAQNAMRHFDACRERMLEDRNTERTQMENDNDKESHSRIE